MAVLLVKDYRDDVFLRSAKGGVAGASGRDAKFARIQDLITCVTHFRLYIQLHRPGLTRSGFRRDCHKLLSQCHQMVLRPSHLVHLCLLPVIDFQ
jgi:hypothetical protein